jgi:hypothetical protein
MFASNSGSLNSNRAIYQENIKRTVTNISNGVEVTMTTTDAKTREHMEAILTQNVSKTPKNSLIKVERVALDNGTKIIMTSTDAATVTSIQERAKNATSGVFGKMGQGKG